MRHSFFEDAIESMYIFEKEFDRSSIGIVKKSASFNIPDIDNRFFPFSYLDESLERFVSLSGPSTELERFYSNIYKSQTINSVPTSIPVSDIAEVKEIKPQYLMQFVDNSADIIEKAINGKINTKFLTPEFTKNLKKQVVVSTIPEYIKDKDLVVLDNRFIMNVNGNFIAQTILPFLRATEVQKKEFIKMSSIIKSTINDCCDKINSYILTYKRLCSENKVNQNSVTTVYEVLKTFITVARYMIVAFIRKVNAYSNNMQEFTKLHETLVRYFPAGERVMHESVLDGENDFETEDIVHSLVNGDSGFLLSVKNRIYQTYYDWLEESYGEDGFDLNLPSMEYDNKSYDNIIVMFKTIAISWKTFYDELQNPDVSIEDILEKSGLSIPFITQFEHFLNGIPNTDFYTSYEDAKAKDVYISILNELKMTDKTITNLGPISYKLYRKLKSIEESVSQNINNQYENHERNIETLEVIRNVEKNYRDFLVKLSIAILDRYKKLESLLVDNDKNLDTVDNFKPDLNDYAKEATKANLELMETVHLIELDEMYKEFNKVIVESYFDDISDVIMEADANAQPSVNTNDQNASNNNNNQNSSNNTNQNSNDNKNSTSATVQDNNSESNSNSSNNDNSGKSGLPKIIESIKNFIKSLIEKIKGLVKTNQTNSQWLAANKENLLKRSYTNTSINILPYVEDSDPLKMISDIGNSLASLKDSIASSTRDDIEKKLIKAVDLNKIKVPNAEKDGTLSQKITQYLKVGTAKLELVQKNDGEVASLIPKMIEYCENYYNNFEKELTSASDKVTQNFENFCQQIQNDNTPVDTSNNNDNNESLQSKITSIGTLVQTALGASVNAARDRAQDYMKVLQAFAPKGDVKDNNKNTNDNTNNNTNNNQEQTQENNNDQNNQ